MHLHPSPNSKGVKDKINLLFMIKVCGNRRGGWVDIEPCIEFRRLGLDNVSRDIYKQDTCLSS